MIFRHAIGREPATMQAPMFPLFALTVLLGGRAGAPASSRPLAVEARGTLPSFEEVYEEHFDYVWRSLRQLGVSEADADDALQEAFLVVHRRLPEFEGRSSLRTWLMAIVLRVAQEHRRSVRRKERSGARAGIEVDPEAVRTGPGSDPHERAETSEDVRLLERLLDQLDEEKREAFVLAELEQLSVPEIAELLGRSVHTVAARLRAARQAFEQALHRERLREAHRTGAGGAARRMR